MTYRDPAPTRRTSALVASDERCSARSALLLTVIAIAGGAIAATMVGSAALFSLIGAGALAATAHWIASRVRRRRHRRVADFLGGEQVSLTPGGWCSLDGTRRLRSRDGDRLARFERVDPSSGQTLASFRAETPVMPAPVERAPISVRWATVAGRRPLAPCCFVGVPPEVGRGDATLPSVDRVILSVFRDGALVERCDADGVLVGDTWHRDAAVAREQLAREYGPHLGELREVGEAGSAIARSCAWSWDRRGGVAL